MKDILEEVAENYVDSFEYGIAHPRRVCKNAFINGAKWQQERSYSEEDMADAFLACWKANVLEGVDCKLSFKEWFEQFKKK